MHEILIEEKILAENDSIAGDNRRALKERNIFSINIVSSPGAGKTSILEAMTPYLKRLVGDFAVIEGDLRTDLDSRRLSALGVPVRQISTGRACHLDAHSISRTLEWVLGQGLKLLIIENVGNMVCPAEYDLGEDMMVSVMSTAEGDDKPLKYPAIFAKSDVLLLNKVDLLPYTPFSLKKARENALSINPNLFIFETSCTTGAGIREWSEFLAEAVLRNRS